MLFEGSPLLESVVNGSSESLGRPLSTAPHGWDEQEPCVRAGNQDAHEAAYEVSAKLIYSTYNRCPASEPTRIWCPALSPFHRAIKTCEDKGGCSP